MDHLVNSLVSRFPEDMSPSLAAGLLHTKDVAKLTPDTIANIYTFYKDDLPRTTTPDSFRREVKNAVNQKMKLVVLFSQLSLGKKLYLLSKMIYSIFIVPKVYLTTPVTSNVCERSFSALRRLKSWTRSTIGQSRLNGITLLHVHSNKIHPIFLSHHGFLESDR